MLKSTILISILYLFANNSQAQNDLGNWLMYFGTNKINNHWSLHTEVQYRNHTVAPVNAEQLLLRTGFNYHLIESKAIATMGYGFINNYEFEPIEQGPIATEHRIFEQFIAINHIGRVKLEHRYRVEQRWVNSVYKNRLRYRINALVPINKDKIEKSTLFFSVYDEIFINDKNNYFDRNRFYVALGYQLSKLAGIQVGILNQATNAVAKNYLQFSFICNTDFSKK